MKIDLGEIKGREPLIDYPWQTEINRLLQWLLDKSAVVSYKEYNAFYAS